MKPAKWMYTAAGTVLGVSLLINAAFATGTLQRAEAYVVQFAWNVGGHAYTSAEPYNDGSEQLPTSLNYKGTTYIPIRLLAETLGNGVRWDDETKTAFIAEEGDGDDPTADLPAEARAKPKQMWNDPALLTSNTTLLAAPDAKAEVLSVMTAGTKVNLSMRPAGTG